MNKVFLNKDDFIEQVYEGKQTFQTVMEASAKVMVLADGLNTKKKKVGVLVNIDKITSVSADALLASADTLNSTPDSKIAAFGGNALLHKLANLVILATGRSKTVRVFKSLSQAERWLK